MDEARALMAKDRPSLAIFEHDPPRINGMEMCRAIRQQENDREHQLPVVMVAAQEDLDIGAAADVTDWLIKPFTDDKALTDGIIDDDENGLRPATLSAPASHFPQASRALKPPAPPHKRERDQYLLPPNDIPSGCCDQLSNPDQLILAGMQQYAPGPPGRSRLLPLAHRSAGCAAAAARTRPRAKLPRHREG
jgi:CheY-like chemotaxis protein